MKSKLHSNKLNLQHPRNTSTQLRGAVYLLSEMHELFCTDIENQSVALVRVGGIFRNNKYIVLWISMEDITKCSSFP